MKRELSPFTSSRLSRLPPLLRLRKLRRQEGMCRIFWWGLSSNGAITKYLQGKTWGFPESGHVFVYVDFNQTPVIQSLFPLISDCKLYLGAKSVTCLKAVKCRRLCWHMEEERNGCQTSRGWADANQETGRTSARTITITLFTKYSLIWQHWFWASRYWYNRTVKTTPLHKLHIIPQIWYFVWLLRVCEGKHQYIITITVGIGWLNQL